MSRFCAFCNIVAGRQPVAIVYQDAELLAFRDIAPRAPIHVLIVPTRHVETLEELDDDPELLGRLLQAALRIAAAEGVSETGYRILVNTGVNAHQTVQHAHLHVLGGAPLNVDEATQGWRYTCEHSHV